MDKKLSVEMLRMQDFQFNEEEMIVLCGGRSTNETSSEIEEEGVSKCKYHFDNLTV